MRRNVFRALFLAMLLLPLLEWNGRAQEAKASQMPGVLPWTEQFRKHDPDLAELMDLADMAPPELRAKALIIIANSPQLKTQEWKRNILLEAVESAGLAHDPVPHFIPDELDFRHSTDGHRHSDLEAIGSRTSMQREIFREKMDRLSLQTAAIAGVFTFDVPTAKDLYLRMPPLEVERLSCDDALIPEPGAYYELLGKIVRSGFSPEERRAQRHVELLYEKIRAMTSPLELEPMSAVLRTASLTPGDLSFLIAQYSYILANMDPDDRSFSASFVRVAGEIYSLIDFVRSQKISPGPLVAAYRTYLINGLTGERCAYTVENSVEGDLMGRLNEEISKEGNASLAPLPMDLKPARILGKPNFELLPLSNSLSAKDFVRSVVELAGLMRTVSAEATEASHASDEDSDKGKREREVRFDHLLQSLEDMQALPEEDNEHYVLRKGQAFAWAITVLPPGPESEKLMLRYVDFLNSIVPSSSLLSWIAPLRGLLIDSPFSNTESQKLMLRALVESGAPALRLYARLELIRQARTEPHWLPKPREAISR